MAGDEAADQRRSESEELNYTRRRRNEPHARQNFRIAPKVSVSWGIEPPTKGHWTSSKHWQ